MEKVNFTINGIPVEANVGQTIREAAECAGVKIPKICYTDFQNTGVTIKPVTCRVCEVEVYDGKVMAACVASVKEGMNVRTNSKVALDARRKRLEALLTDHPQECLSCTRSLDCELQTLAQECGIKEFPITEFTIYGVDESSPSLVRDQAKCIGCRRCDAVCTQIQTVGALDYDRSINKVLTKDGLELSETDCINCGLCIVVCPTAAIRIRDYTDDVWALLQDPDKFTAIQVAPSVRAGMGDLYGMPPGTDVEKKVVAGLKMLGFDKVYNCNFAADLTIMEEAAELVHRVTKGGVLPMTTSCCPGWVKFAETEYPDLLPHVSSCKSPMEMFSAAAKGYMPKKLGVEPEKFVFGYVGPCTAKKYEAKRPEMNGNTDFAISTVELGQMFKMVGIDLHTIPPQEYDNTFSEASGAGEIFGVSGGVMEAAVRTAYYNITGENMENLDILPLRGFEGSNIKTASVMIGDLEVKVAVAHELRNARILMDEVRAGTSPYHFFEVMACPGGCVNGAGQPSSKSNTTVVAARHKALIDSDKNNVLRKSHENKEIKALYEEYLGEPYYGEVAHKILHTHYTPRQKAAEKVKN
jgi:iron-only hydrogenase group A